MKTRPILFSGAMVRAILDGSKTQTRRFVKPQPAPNAPHDGGTTWTFRPKDGLHVPYGTVGHLTVRERMGLPCPYGVPGDRLWVRETWGYRGALWSSERPDVQEYDIAYQADDQRKRYTFASEPPGLPKCPTQGPDESTEEFYADTLTRYWRSWRPSIHMPRWASRLTLEVTGVRVERLHDISEEDAMAEGAAVSNGHPELGALIGAGPSHREGFAQLWRDINGVESWTANPWVWVVKFRRVPEGR
jgi:hypothetical protein